MKGGIRLAYVTVPKDLSKIKTKVAFNLTKRQIVCLGAALLVGLPLFFLLKGSAGTTLAAMAMIVVMLPCFLFAMYERHGQPLEVVVKNIIQTKFTRPKERPYQTENFYAVLERQRKLEKEVSAIVKGTGAKGAGSRRSPVVQDALEDDGQCLRTTGGDEDLILFKVHVQFIIIGLDGVDQFRYPRGRGVLQDRGLEVTHCLKELRRGLHVGLADVQMIDLAALGLRCDCVGVELPHRGQTALLYFARKLHVHTSGFSYLRVESGIALTLLYVCMDEKSIAIQDKNGEDFRGMSIPRGKGGKPLW